MVKKFLTGLAAIISMATPVYAGPKPPDVPAYTSWTPQYASGSNPNDPINANTVTPWRGLTPIETSDVASWYTFTAGGSDDTGGFVLCPLEVGGHAGTECKFRTTCTTSFIAKDDPIRNYGQPGTSHLHQFFGAEQVNAWSTYASLRNSRRSSCAGGADNNTAYWMPSFTKVMGDGKTYAVRYRVVTDYYRQTWDHTTAHGPYGLRFVSGAEMDDNWAWMDTVIANANAQPGTAGRYRWTQADNTTKPHVRFACTGGAGLAFPYIKTPDGSDPWAGTCTAGMEFNVQLDFSQCWDGTNLWSSDGYHNVIPMIWDNVQSRYTCPQNSYVIFSVAMQALVAHGGWADYSTWTLASDAAFQTMINASASPRTIGVGESFHSDWMDGASPFVRFKWESDCMGAENGRGHECGDSTFGSGYKLFVSETPPDGRRLHQITILPEGSLAPSTTANMWLVPTTTSGGHGHDMHGAIDVMNGEKLAINTPFSLNEHGE